VTSVQLKCRRIASTVDLVLAIHRHEYGGRQPGTQNTRGYLGCGVIALERLGHEVLRHVRTPVIRFTKVTRVAVLDAEVRDLRPTVGFCHAVPFGIDVNSHTIE